VGGAGSPGIEGEPVPSFFLDSTWDTIHTITAMTPMIMSMFEAARGKRFKA
jgi:hypothetical protein